MSKPRRSDLEVLTDDQVRSMFPDASEAGFQAPRMRALLACVDAVAEAIRDSGSRGIPSGHLYAVLMGVMDINLYQSIISILKRAGLVTEQSHLLTWSGPR